MIGSLSQPLNSSIPAEYYYLKIRSAIARTQIWLTATPHLDQSQRQRDCNDCFRGKRVGEHFEDWPDKG